MTKSNNRMSDFVNWHASRPYNKVGMHLAVSDTRIATGNDLPLQKSRFKYDMR